MKVSLNWVREYLDFDLPAHEELVEKIGAQLGAVEEVIDLGAKYKDVVIVKVVTCEPLENSDHLHKCMVDDGGIVQGVERDGNGLVQVLTGAPNVHADMMAVWLAPGVTVPESYDDKEPFVLTARPMRGAMSNGMLASAKELAIGESHEGLLDLTNEIAPDDTAIQPGADFAKVFGLNDIVIDIENKMFTHRPDCFGQLGVAREIAGILGHEFKSPQMYTMLDEITSGEGLELTISNDIPDQVPRFMAVAMKNVTIKPSPIWLQILLARVGAKPISNVVDVTNYMMLLTGQPLHAYDYDKVTTKKLGASLARKGETIKLLNGKTIELNTADMVITDGEKPIGLAGVMGGEETEVSSDTKNIILECATFDMYTIRRTSMRHGLFTDAVTRYNKGQSPLQNPFVVQLTIGHLQTLSGAEIASEVLDDNHTVEPASVTATAEFINARLGFSLSVEEMKSLLTSVEFKVDTQDSALTVTSPFWRTDIELPEDVVEEVGRLYGFDKLPLELPQRTIKPAVKNITLELKQRVRSVLVKSGANEVLTYSFVHEDLLRKTGQDPDKAYRLDNALSPDLQYYRLSLTPSLLAKVNANIKAGHDKFALFELGKTHFVDEMDADEPGIPNEDNHIALTLAYGKKQQPKGAPYYQALKYLSQVVDLENVQLQTLSDFDAESNDWSREFTAAFEPARSAVIVSDGQTVGVIGEYKTKVRRALKLPDYSAGFELNLDAVMPEQKTYRPLSKFPSVSQDITLKIPVGLKYAELQSFVSEKLKEKMPLDSYAKLVPGDIYQKEDDLEHKQVTFRLTLTDYDRTLQDKEVNTLLDDLAEQANQKFGAERI